MVSDKLKELAAREELTEDDVKDLTLEECHRVLWWRLYLTGDRNKRSAPILNVRHSAYECYVCNLAEKLDMCGSCPIKWAEFGSCGSAGSPYANWELAKTEDERKKYAKIIAELPFKQ